MTFPHGGDMIGAPRKSRYKIPPARAVLVESYAPTPPEVIRAMIRADLDESCRAIDRAEELARASGKISHKILEARRKAWR